MATVTKPIALDESFNTTEVTPRNIADVLAEGLSHITGRTASEVEYDNTDSGLTADNVQDALDEIVEDIPTVPSVDIQTAVDEFETYNGGLLSECKVALSPNQDLHGYENPWVGGAGKNKANPDNLEVGYYSTTGYNNSPNFKTTEPIAVENGQTYSGSLFNSNDLTERYNAVLTTFSSGDTTNAIRQVVGESITIQSGESFIRIRNNSDQTPLIQSGDFCYQLEKSASATAYEPYSNICPISGHTQVEVDVSDGQTTQEQITVNLGGTYYSGTLDVVSGVFVSNVKEVVFDGSDDEGWTIAPSDVNAYFYCNASDMTSTAWKYIWSESFKTIQVNTDRSIENTIWGIYQQIHIHASSAIAPSGATSTGLAEFKTWLSNNPQKVVYELATPQSIQLSPTMVKALVGENHLSAPLNGQEITESKYKQMFTFDDVIAYIQSLS